MKDMPLDSESINNSRTNKNVNRKAIFGCLAAFVLGMVLTFFGGVAVWWYFYAPVFSELLDAKLIVPATAEIGESIKMHVEVSNNNSKSVTLHSIDIDEEFLEGFQVLGVVPKSSGVLNLRRANARAWIFDKPIAPNQNLVITYSLRPINEGHYSGNVSVFDRVNSMATIQAVDVVVKP